MNKTENTEGEQSRAGMYFPASETKAAAVLSSLTQIPAHGPKGLGPRYPDHIMSVGKEEEKGGRKPPSSKSTAPYTFTCSHYLKCRGAATQATNEAGKWSLYPRESWVQLKLWAFITKEDNRSWKMNSILSHVPYSSLYTRFTAWSNYDDAS